MKFFDGQSVFTTAAITVLLFFINLLLGGFTQPNFDVNVTDLSTNIEKVIISNSWKQAKDATVFIQSHASLQIIANDCVEGVFSSDKASNVLRINFTRISPSVQCKLDIQNNGEKINKISITALDSNGFQWTEQSKSTNLLISALVISSIVAFIITTGISSVYFFKRRKKSIQIKKLHEEKTTLEKQIDDHEKTIIHLVNDKQKDPGNVWITKRLLRYENEIIDKKNKLAKIDKQILNVSEDEKYTPSIESVSIDKKIYIPGEHVHVNGNIGKRIPNVTIRAFVFDPNGKEVSKSNIDVNKDNSFSATIEPDGLWFEDGIYKLKLEYEFDDKKDEKIIEFNFKANDIWRYATLHKPLKVGPVMRIRKEPRPKSVSRPESRLKEIQNAIEVNAKFAETQKIMLDKDIPSVIIELSVSEESECKIKIPRIVLDSKVGEEDDKFIVLVNGAEIDFHEVISTSHREIALLLEKDYLQIEIIGTITSLTTD